MSANQIEVSELATLIVGLIALFAGTRIRQMVPMLKRIDMPNAVIGAMIVALLVVLAQVMFGTEVVFGAKLRDLLLLVFFTTIGLSAKLTALRAGGRPLVILCAVTVLLLVAQNLGGIAVAGVWGAHPFCGLLAGSLSFVGGPGTALAWAKDAGLLLPGFLSAMLAGVLLTNLADWTRFGLEFEPIQKGGEIALNLFLVLSLVSARLIAARQEQ